MTSGIQFIAIIFALLLLYVTYIHYKKRVLSFFEVIFFSLIWITAILLMILPQTANFILAAFHVYRLLDLATIVGFMLLVGISYKNYLELKHLRKKIEKIAREYTLRSINK